MNFWIQSFSVKLLKTQFSQIVQLCLQLDNQRDLQGHQAATLLLISLSEVELLLINAHFLYARAAHGMFCITSLQPHLSVQYFNITIRLWTCTTLTTSEPGEQSVPGEYSQDSPMPADVLLLGFQQFQLLLCFLLIILVYISIALVNEFFFILTRDPL